MTGSPNSYSASHNHLQQQLAPCYHQCTIYVIIFHCDRVLYHHWLHTDNRCERPYHSIHCNSICVDNPSRDFTSGKYSSEIHGRTLYNDDDLRTSHYLERNIQYQKILLEGEQVARKKIFSGSAYIILHTINWFNTIYQL
jgi:hypothetical protein